MRVKFLHCVWLSHSLCTWAHAHTRTHTGTNTRRKAEAATHKCHQLNCVPFTIATDDYKDYCDGDRETRQNLWRENMCIGHCAPCSNTPKHTAKGNIISPISCLFELFDKSVNSIGDFLPLFIRSVVSLLLSSVCSSALPTCFLRSSVCLSLLFSLSSSRTLVYIWINHSLIPLSLRLTHTPLFATSFCPSHSLARYQYVSNINRRGKQIEQINPLEWVKNSKKSQILLITKSVIR